MKTGTKLSFLPARLRPLDWLLTFAAPLALTLGMEAAARAHLLDALLWAVRAPLMLLCNYGLILGVCLLLSLIRSDRLRASLTLALGLFCALLGVANHYKTVYRMEPILLSDAMQLGDLLSALKGLDFDINLIAVGLVCLGFAGAIVLCCVLLRGRQPTRPVLPALAGVALLCGLPFLCTFSLANGNERTDMMDHARNEGMLYAAIAMENHRRDLMRLDYSEEAVRAAYRELEALAAGGGNGEGDGDGGASGNSDDSGTNNGADRSANNGADRSVNISGNNGTGGDADSSGNSGTNGDADSSGNNDTGGDADSSGNSGTSRNTNHSTSASIANHNTSAASLAEATSLPEASSSAPAPAPAPSPSPSSPNVVVVLSESFTDEKWLGRYLHLTDTLTPFYNELLAQCYSGRLRVPKLGGGTSETEFEVLTGLQSKYALNPYAMGLPPMNSLASVLSEKGYEATAIHWLIGVYYNRYHNLKREGFDAFYTTDTTTTAFEKRGAYVSDAEHYGAVLQTMRQTDGRDFIFCITMQNHGGYAYDDFRQTYGADTPFTNVLSAESEKIAANYCWLLRQSDEELRAFIAQLEAFDEPVELVFFGDHIPPMGEETYKELGVPLSGEEGHWTPYFIWRNDQTLSGGEDLRAWQLGARALALAGLCDDPFFSYVERLRREGRAEDDRYDLLCYDALFGRQYAYDEGGLSPENPDFLIGGPMNLSGFDTAKVGGESYLRPRLSVRDQAYTLYLNGRALSQPYLPAVEGPLTLQCVMVSSTGARLNQSEVLRYESRADLLQSAGTLTPETLPLWESAYELIEDKWYRDAYVFKSLNAFPLGGCTALVAGGERFRERLWYEVRGAGQYCLAEDGRLILAVKKSALGNADALPEALRGWLREKDARLYRLGEAEAR